MTKIKKNVSKSEETQKRILQIALEQFRQKGFEATTMRDIASLVGLSLGAAYYYFDSKEAIVLAYYAQTQNEHERLAADIFAKTSDLKERLSGAFHLKLEILRNDRKLLGALFRSIGDPEAPLSVFAQKTTPLRAQAINLFRQAVSVADMPEDLKDLMASSLWGLHLAVLLYFLHDTSEDQQQTHSLVDGLIELTLQLAVLVALPGMEDTRERLVSLLSFAKILRLPLPPMTLDQTPETET
jgi:AcrR family transcriptional regulator